VRPLGGGVVILRSLSASTLRSGVGLRFRLSPLGLRLRYLRGGERLDERLRERRRRGEGRRILSFSLSRSRRGGVDDIDLERGRLLPPLGGGERDLDLEGERAALLGGGGLERERERDLDEACDPRE